MDLSMKREPKTELEDHFILRLPLQQADYIRNILHTKSKKIKRKLKINLNLESRSGTVVINNNVLEGCLRKLPTIVESLKTHDKSTCVKTADICEILDCTDGRVGGDLIHGVAPPLKNVKKKRFRKSLINRDETAVNVQKELFYLLQTDLEAVSTKFEVIYLDNEMKNHVFVNAGSNNNIEKCEIELFGNVLTDSEETDSNIEEIDQ